LKGEMTVKTVRNNRKLQTPKLRHHKASGRAYVVLNNRAIYLGYWGTEEAEENYRKTIAEWLANGKQPDAAPNNITINEMLARFWVYAEGYYRDCNGKTTTELGNIRVSLRPFCALYGHTKAVEFGPRSLKTVRQKMIAMGWCRNNINKSISRLKTVFKWAVAEEIIPGSVYQALMAVPGLKRGRSDARESEPVKPVPQEYVDAIEPYVSRQIWAMIQLQLLTAARPSEILTMRPCEIDRSSKIWVYSPAEHKTAHHGHERKIYIGPRGQDILRPFLIRPADSYCFSPAEAEAERRATMHENRKTYLSCGNVPGSNCKENPERTKGNLYHVANYRRAISRAIKIAFPAPEHLRQRFGETKQQWRKRLTKQEKDELKAWYKQYHWHPHQLRHNAATFLRKEFGLETARIILGHRSAVITEVYAELDQQKAMEAVVRVG
jgi:integrase